MRRVGQAPNAAIAQLWIDMLGEAGIAASMQRYFLGAAAGELPPDQCLPEIWVHHDEQEAAARSKGILNVGAMATLGWPCSCGALHAHGKREPGTLLRDTFLTMSVGC